MTRKENTIRAWRRQTPDWIPISSGFPYLDWEKFGYDVNELEDICLKHSILLPDFVRGSLKKNHEAVKELYPDMVEEQSYTDYWGCVWKTIHTGMLGVVIFHPLADAGRKLEAPDPDKNDGLRAINWEKLQKDAKFSKEHGDLFGVGLPHGHTFLRAQDIRGYADFIQDIADEEPIAEKLLDIITDFNEKLVKRMLALSPDVFYIPEDLGMQTSPMITPAMFSQYIAPCYRRLTKPVKEHGILIHQHSDGYIMPLLDNLIETGCDIINLQDLVNGIDNIREATAGRIAIDLDIDRQKITVFGTVGDIDDHIRECVSKLGYREGGLSLCYQPWPPTPPENVDAVWTAMEKYCVKEYIN